MNKSSFVVVNLSGPRLMVRECLDKLILKMKLNGYEVPKKEMLMASILLFKIVLGSSAADGTELVETAGFETDVYADNGNFMLYILGELFRETNVNNFVPWINYAALELKR